MRALLASALLFVTACTGARGPAPDTEFLFESKIAPVLANFDFSDPRAWVASRAGHIPSIELASASDYQPPFRSPHSIALLHDLEFGDFIFELDAMQTGREYGHRDLCLFFGFQSPERYYYVHLAPSPDANAHNVFLVDGADRRAMLEVQPAGFDWGTNEWHRLRLERRIDDGLIALYVDDALQATFRLHDSTLNHGRIGFGSFDDTGRFANVRVSAPAVRRRGLAPAFPSR